VSHRHATLLLCLYFALVALVVIPSAHSKPTPTRIIGYGQVKFQGHGPEWWEARARAWHRAYIAQRRHLLSSPTVRDAINLAAATYGYGPVLWRNAECESHLYPFAHNACGAAGLFQFLPSTFDSTPYGSFSIFDPFANALAAGWMHAHGRGGEWVCQ